MKLIPITLQILIRFWADLILLGREVGHSEAIPIVE
jgi:hypothetical protein